MSARENLSGRILNHRYKVGDLIGAGGFGSTYHAQDLARFDAACVVKELLPARLNDMIARRLFEREARLLSQLQHPQIPNLQAYFEEEDRFYLVQDFVPGQTLRARLQRTTRIPEAEVQGIVASLLGVLEYLHQREPPVIHRDIKPANIILGSNGLPYLIDFGAVREVLTEDSHTSIGTAGYTPREQAVGHARPSSDYYALGATALEAVSGEHPLEWHDKSTGMLDFQGRVECSPQFERVLSGLLADVPRRFNSVEQIRNAMRVDSVSVQSSSTPQSNSATLNAPASSVPPIGAQQVGATHPVSSQVVATQSVSPQTLAPQSTKAPTPTRPSHVLSAAQPTNAVAQTHTSNERSVGLLSDSSASDSSADALLVSASHSDAPEIQASAPAATIATKHTAASSTAEPPVTVETSSLSIGRFLPGVLVGLVIIAVITFVTKNEKSPSPAEGNAVTPAQTTDSLPAVAPNTAPNSVSGATSTVPADSAKPATDTPKATANAGKSDSVGAPASAGAGAVAAPAATRAKDDTAVTNPALCSTLLERLTLGDGLSPEEKKQYARCKKKP